MGLTIHLGNLIGCVLCVVGTFGSDMLLTNAEEGKKNKISLFLNSLCLAAFGLGFLMMMHEW